MNTSCDVVPEAQVGDTWNTCPATSEHRHGEKPEMHQRHVVYAVTKLVSCSQVESRKGHALLEAERLRALGGGVGLLQEVQHKRSWSLAGCTGSIRTGSVPYLAKRTSLKFGLWAADTAWLGVHPLCDTDTLQPVVVSMQHYLYHLSPPLLVSTALSLLHSPPLSVSVVALSLSHVSGSLPHPQASLMHSLCTR